MEKKNEGKEISLEKIAVEKETSPSYLLIDLKKCRFSTRFTPLSLATFWFSSFSRFGKRSVSKQKLSMFMSYSFSHFVVMIFNNTLHELKLLIR